MCQSTLHSGKKNMATETLALAAVMYIGSAPHQGLEYGEILKRKLGIEVFLHFIDIMYCQVYWLIAFLFPPKHEIFETCTFYP